MHRLFVVGESVTFLDVLKGDLVVKLLILLVHNGHQIEAADVTADQTGPKCELLHVLLHFYLLVLLVVSSCNYSL